MRTKKKSTKNQQSAEPVDLRHRDVTRHRKLDEDRLGYRIFDQMRPPEAVEAGRHPGCERELSVVDTTNWETLFTAFQRPQGGWFIDVETAAIKLVGWKVLGHSIHGFTVRTDDEALDWMKFLGALATQQGRA